MSSTTQPVLYEINTPVFLREVGLRVGHYVTLADVSDAEWDAVAKPGVTAIWLMGVWQRSPISISIVNNEEWAKAALAGGEVGEPIGSAYSTQGYSVNDAFGGNEALVIARAKLKERGLDLILDFVPNHVAIDHPWAAERPDYFLRGSEQELQAHPGGFVRTPGGIFANGKDPNYSPWTDVLQLNAFSSSFRQQSAQTLLAIADMCDGVRCDMAMLMMNTIFSGTWGDRAGDSPVDEYWPAIINAVERVHPDFLFIAEAYWGKEQDLLDQGFDFCYDKELYDQLLRGSVMSIKDQLRKPLLYQKHLMRFIENHDEERAAHKLSFDKHTAAAVIMSTLPGAKLYHEGQREGRQVRVPVHFARRANEKPNEGIALFYDKLWDFIASKDFSQQKWRLVKTSKKLSRRQSHRVLAWEWTTDTERFVVAVNYYHRKARVSLDTDIKHAKSAEDVMGGAVDLADCLRGSQLRLRPWQHVIINLDTR